MAEDEGQLEWHQPTLGSLHLNVEADLMNGVTVLQQANASDESWSCHTLPLCVEPFFCEGEGAREEEIH